MRTSEPNRAAVLHGAKDLRLQERATPRPADGEALVAVEAVGLCGSDLHYYCDGRNGTNALTAPAVLGHEIGGAVLETGPGAPGELRGCRVVVEPAVPCRTCPLCTAGRYNLCPRTSCLGSPPVDGGLTHYLAVPAAHLHPAPAGLEAAAVPLLEPLAVAVHALRRCRFTPAESVLVTGAGTIGLLTAQVARAWGAGEVVVSDVHPERLRTARALGFDRAVPAGELGGISVERALECSGTVEALSNALAATAPGGGVALVGTIPAEHGATALSAIQRHEVDLVGAFRYAGSFPEAVDLVARGAVDVRALITDRFPLDRAGEALEHAAGGGGLKTVVDCAAAA
ncbi:alcohol dehydrogenase catalytic domain-containing protein [Salinifilum ghardaiensis]